MILGTQNIADSPIAMPACVHRMMLRHFDRCLRLMKGCDSAYSQRKGKDRGYLRIVALHRWLGSLLHVSGKARWRNESGQRRAVVDPPRDRRNVLRQWRILHGRQCKNSSISWGNGQSSFPDPNSLAKG